MPRAFKLRRLHYRLPARFTLACGSLSLATKRPLARDFASLSNNPGNSLSPFAYYWNSRYVFRSGERRTPAAHVRAYLKAFVSYGSTFLLSTALLTLLVEACGIPAGIAPLVCLLVTIPLNFVLNKYWAFRSHKAKPDAETDKLE